MCSAGVSLIIIIFIVSIISIPYSYFAYWKEQLTGLIAGLTSEVWSVKEVGPSIHRRRLKTEEKAKIVAAACYASYFAPGRLEEWVGIHQDYMKNWINWTRIIWRIRLIPFFKSSWCKIAIESILSFKQQRWPLPSLLSLSFFYVCITPQSKNNIYNNLSLDKTSLKRFDC